MQTLSTFVNICGYRKTMSYSAVLFSYRLSSFLNLNVKVVGMPACLQMVLMHNHCTSAALFITLHANTDPNCMCSCMQHQSTLFDQLPVTMQLHCCFDMIKPVQLLPVSRNPTLQWHIQLPTVFTHVASVWQSSRCCSHSSMSACRSSTEDQMHLFSYLPSRFPVAQY